MAKNQKNQFKKSVDKAFSKIQNLQKRGYIPITVTGFGNSKNNDSSVVSSCAEWANKSMLGTGSNLIPDGKQIQAISVDSKTVKGKYIAWGSGNDQPNRIAQLVAALPYTAAAMEYIINLTQGHGPKPTYVWARYAGGTVKEESIPYPLAGTLILNRLIELSSRRDALDDDESQDDGVNGESEGRTFGNGNLLPENQIFGNGGEEGPRKGGKHTRLKEYLDKEIDQLVKDYEKWESTSQWLREFLENNNLCEHYEKYCTDDAHMNIAFPTIGLSRGKSGKWNPKIVKLGFLPCVCTRYEEMSKDLKIENVFYAERWRKECTPNLQVGEVIAYPVINSDSAIEELNSWVSRQQRQKVNERTAWFCIPLKRANMLRPYYPQPMWWSIFLSYVYNYAYTMMFDKAAARNNSTMWGKIIYINLNYLQKLYDQMGATNEEEQDAIKTSLINDINQFLKKRDNNGKTVALDAYLSQDEKTLVKSIEIVDVPQPQNAKDLKAELEEVSSIIFFAMGVHPELIGSRPGSSGKGGTFQRELHLLKEQQVSPSQRRYLWLLDMISTFNDCDKHLKWVIEQQNLTTLDNSKTGVVSTESK